MPKISFPTNFQHIINEEKVEKVRQGFFPKTTWPWTIEVVSKWDFFVHVCVLVLSLSQFCKLNHFSVNAVNGAKKTFVKIPLCSVSKLTNFMERTTQCSVRKREIFFRLKNVKSSALVTSIVKTLISSENIDFQ